MQSIKKYKKQKQKVLVNIQKKSEYVFAVSWKTKICLPLYDRRAIYKRELNDMRDFYEE